MWFSLFQHATLLLFRFLGGQSASQVVKIIEIFFKYFARVCSFVCACDRPVGKALSIIILRLF